MIEKCEVARNVKRIWSIMERCKDNKFRKVNEKIGKEEWLRN